VLAVEGLNVWFRAKPAPARIIDGVSFTVERGRTLCLVGESGCGKSVTALAIMGLLPRPPAEIRGGSIRFDGRDLLRLPTRELAELRGDRLSMIFQEPMTSLNPVFTIGRQLTEIIRRHRRVPRAEALARARLMLERVRIPEPERRLGQYPHELSGGMRQRAMIAMALANEPLLLIADEPTTALDVTIQAQILALIRRLQAETGSAVVLITHDLGVVAEMAHEVAVMYAGKLLEKAPVAAIFADPQHPYTLGLMSAVPRLERGRSRLASIAGTVPPPHRFPPGCRFSTRCPFADARCRELEPPLAELGAGHAAACWKAPLERAAARELAA
jgi:oligopeptide/dipeptide ABC transporter ATP-binding protein